MAELEDALEKLCELDSSWGEKYAKVVKNPWSGGVLPQKTIELNLSSAQRRLHQSLS